MNFFKVLNKKDNFVYTKDQIRNHYNEGIYIIEILSDNVEKYNDKWIANKIKYKKIYSLLEISTYEKLGLPIDDYYNNILEMDIKKLIKIWNVKK